MKRLILLAVMVVAGWGQVAPSALLVTRVYGIVAGWSGDCATGVIRNTTVSRLNDYHSIYATGTGTWTAALQYSDSSCTGPWTAGSSAASITQASNPAIAFLNGYHPYIKIAITGNAVVTYSASKDYFTSSAASAVSFPIDWSTQVGGKPFIDVRDYGADPTGAVDSTAFIQTAVTAAIATQNTVYFPAGTYKVSSKISICSAWKYANIEGSGNGTVFAPTTAFPETTTDATSAVFNSDCGTTSQPNTNVGPSLRNFRITFPQVFTGATRNSLKKWTGLNLNNTLNAKVEHITIELAWDGITFKGTYSSGAWQAVTGRGYFADVGISAYDIGIDIDGMTDNSTFLRIHIWPFGQFTEWFYQTGVRGWRIARVDDLNITDSMCISGKCMEFVAGADGQGGFTKVTNQGFDTFWAIDMPNSGFTGSAGQSVLINNSTFSFNPGGYSSLDLDDYYVIRYNRGSLSISGGYISAVDYRNPAVYIENTASGVSSGVSFSNVGFSSMGVGDVPMVKQVNNANTTNLAISFNNCGFWNYPNITYTAPMVHVAQANPGASLTFTANNFNPLNPGTYGVGLQVVADGLHQISGNNFNYVSATQGWTTSFPATKTYGYYQSHANYVYNPLFRLDNGNFLYVTGTNPGVYLDDGSSYSRYSFQAGTVYDDLPGLGNWKWRSGFTTEAMTLDTYGNLHTAGNVRSDSAFQAGAVTGITKTCSSIGGGATTITGGIVTALTCGGSGRQSMADFQWTVAPASAYATAGAKTLTLAPVPAGVNGTAVLHQVFISDAGNSEVVTITGGTAVSGAASGTITFTTAKTHNNTTWTIGSATCGGKEAEEYIPTGGEIVPPIGQCAFQGTWMVTHNNIKIKGQAGWHTLDNRDKTTGSQFVQYSPTLDTIKVGDITVANLQPTGFELSDVIFTVPTMTVSGAANNGAGLVRLTLNAVIPWSVATGAKVYVSNVGGTTEANGYWTAVVYDSTHIDLTASTFANTYSSGGVVALMKTAGAAVNMAVYSGASIHQISAANQYNALKVEVGDNLRFDDYYITGVTPNVIASASAAIWVDTGMNGAAPLGNDIWIGKGVVAPDQGIYTSKDGPCNAAGFCPNQEPYACLLVNSGGALWVDGIDCLRTGGGLAIIPNASQSVLWPHIVNSYFDTGSGGNLIQPSGSGSLVYGVSMVNDWFTNNNNIGLTVNQTTGGLVDGINASHLRVLNNRQHGIFLEAGNNVNIGSESQLCGNGFGTANTYDGLLINGAGITNWSFQNSLSGTCADQTAQQKYGVDILVTGAGWRVTGNDLSGNTTGAMNLAAAPVSAIAKDNRGVDDATPATITSGTSVTLPTNGASVYYVSGTTALATILGGIKGQTYTFMFTDNSPGGVATGGNIRRTQAAVKYQPLRLTWDGTAWY